MKEKKKIIQNRLITVLYKGLLVFAGIIKIKSEANESNKRRENNKKKIRENKSLTIK